MTVAVSVDTQPHFLAFAAPHKPIFLGKFACSKEPRRTHNAGVEGSSPSLSTINSASYDRFQTGLKSTVAFSVDDIPDIRPIFAALVRATEMRYRWASAVIDLHEMGDIEGAREAMKEADRWRDIADGITAARARAAAPWGQHSGARRPSLARASNRRTRTAARG